MGSVSSAFCNQRCVGAWTDEASLLIRLEVSGRGDCATMYTLGGVFRYLLGSWA